MPSYYFPCGLCGILQVPGFLECGLLAAFQEPFGIQDSIELDEFGHEAGPAGLVARAQSRPVVAVKVFIEENVVTPVRIGLELVRAPINWPLAFFISQKDPAQPIAISLETSKRFIILPDPVGHSILKLSP